jgi:hypothetical protein
MFDVDDWQLTRTADIHGLLYGAHCHRESCVCGIVRTPEAVVTISMVSGACPSTNPGSCCTKNFAYKPRVLPLARSCQYTDTGRMPITRILWDLHFIGCHALFIPRMMRMGHWAKFRGALEMLAGKRRYVFAAAGAVISS